MLSHNFTIMFACFSFIINMKQIKCVRYWPDYGLTIIVDGREVTNVGETSNGDFIIREFELEEDPV